MSFSHVGLDALDYSPGTIRTDISDSMYASLLAQPNWLAALRVGEYGGGGRGPDASVQQVLHYWEETRLNPRSVTMTNSGGINDSATTMTVSLSDGAVLNEDYILKDQAQSLLVAEQIRITGMQVGSSSVTLTVQRGYNGTTAASHSAGAIFDIVATPVIAGSDFGRDSSRSPGLKANLVQTLRQDVEITGRMVALANRNMVPGTPNQLAFQLHERFLEMMIDLNRSLILGIGTPASVQAEAQTFWGLLAMLGYSNPVPNATSVLYDCGGGYLTDILLNDAAIQIRLQGGDLPDAILGHSYVADAIARIFRDQLRLTQLEMTRGYTVDGVRFSTGTRVVPLIVDDYMPNPKTVDGVLALVDLDRVGLVPFPDRFCFLLSAPTRADSDSVSVIAEMSYEQRNTGTDYGYTSLVLHNFVVE